MNSNPSSVILSARGNGLALLISYPARDNRLHALSSYLTYSDSDTGMLECVCVCRDILMDMAEMMQETPVDLLKQTTYYPTRLLTKPHDLRVFAYTISFQTKLKRSDTLFLLPSSYPAQISSCCILSLTSYMSQYPVL